MKERAKFLLEWERRWDAGEGRCNFAELCRVFGVSRETGYYWLRRYRATQDDLRAAETRSSRPKSSPTAVPEEVQDAIVFARKEHPTWGPRKLRAWILRVRPDIPVPSASCFGAILKRRGLTEPRRRRRQPRPAGSEPPQPFSAADRPNAVWCVDFKGWFRTADHQKCYPLTITDAFSRYLLRAEIVLEPNGHAVERIFDSSFQEFGVPDAIRSDNGPPFASTGAGTLTSLAVWWLRLGIRLERIAPGRPDQNGRHERMHRTLGEAIEPIRRSPIEQQRRFDFWRREFNFERPHEAIANKTPAEIYVRSWRGYPRPLIDPSADELEERVVVPDRAGFVRWRKKRLFVSSALYGERVFVSAVEFDRWLFRYGPIPLGHYDETKPRRGLILARRGRRTATISLL